MRDDVAEARRKKAATEADATALLRTFRRMHGRSFKAAFIAMKLGEISRDELEAQFRSVAEAAGVQLAPVAASAH